ncbi:MAG: class I SAM-dependent methyltransferase [Nanoarchaeota archaeon]
MLGEVHGKKIVDYGCGEGKFLEELVVRGAETYGYDISDAMIKEADRKVGDKARLGVIESGKMPLPDSCVDAVVSNLVLMMCPSKEVVKQIFQETHRVLVDGGALIYCITHPAFSDREFTTFRNIFGRGMDYFKEGQRYQFVLRRRDGAEITKESFIDYHYPLEMYLNLLPETGFKLERVKEVPVSGNPVPPYLIVKGSAIK